MKHQMVQVDGFRDTRLPVEYKAVYSLGNIKGEGVITNISMSGIALKTNQALVIGDEIHVQSKISDNLIFEFYGEVPNVQDNMVGILIKEIDPEIQERFTTHIEGMLRMTHLRRTEKY